VEDLDFKLPETIRTWHPGERVVGLGTNESRRDERLGKNG
jgi:hypothetical protein